MKNIHIILFFTLWVILGSCSTYYVSNKQVMEVQQGMSRQNVEKSWVNRITDVLTEVARNGSTTDFFSALRQLDQDYCIFCRWKSYGYGYL